jgi:imidazolonepropionase-like amidohydrolase
MEAIKAATYEAAKLLRLGNSLGALQAGKIADVIAIRGNPLTDPAMLRNVDLVIQDGKIAALDNQLTVDLLSDSRCLAQVADKNPAHNVYRQ